MPDITIASTTDTQEDVNIAAGLSADAHKAEEKVNSEAEEPELSEPEADESDAEQEEPAKGAADPDAADEVEEEEPEPEPKKRGGFQKRIDRLTEDKYELQDRLEAMERELAQVKAGKQPEAPKGDPKPTQENFKTPEEYHEALGAWSARKQIAAERALDRQRQQQAEDQETFNTYNEAVATFKEEHDDYEEVVGNKNVQIPAAVQVAVVQAGPEGPAIAYYLGQHPEFCKKLLRMSDARAVLEVGKVAASLAEEQEKEEEPAPPPPRKKTVSRAPAPIRKVGGSSTSSTVALDELPYAEFRAARDQQVRGRRR